MRAAYHAEVWFTDRHLGRLLAFIEEQPWGAKTAVVVTSDHSEVFSEHNMTWSGMELWEELVHVPLVIHLPGAPPHRVPVRRGQIELAPTLLEIFGVAWRKGELAGASLLGVQERGTTRGQPCCPQRRRLGFAPSLSSPARRSSSNARGSER